ncbi:hypothetical protein [Loktanella sp. S4079]|nr:hypothetical protein [Loktanella sp. S4079]
MRTMLLAFACASLIAVIAYFGLNAAGFDAASSTAGPSVRLSE